MKCRINFFLTLLLLLNCWNNYVFAVMLQIPHISEISEPSMKELNSKCEAEDIELCRIYKKYHMLEETGFDFENNENYCKNYIEELSSYINKYTCYKAGLLARISLCAAVMQMGHFENCYSILPILDDVERHSSEWEGKLAKLLHLIANDTLYRYEKEKKSESDNVDISDSLIEPTIEMIAIAHMLDVSQKEVYIEFKKKLLLNSEDKIEPETMLNLGQLYENVGKNNLAKDIYSTIVKEFPQTRYSSRANESLINIENNKTTKKWDHTVEDQLREQINNSRGTTNISPVFPENPSGQSER